MVAGAGTAGAVAAVYIANDEVHPAAPHSSTSLAFEVFAGVAADVVAHTSGS